jgi:hypothetical protein
MVASIAERGYPTQGLKGGKIKASLQYHIHSLTNKD